MLDVFSGLPGVREDKKRGSRSGRLALPTLFLLVLTFTLDLIQVFDALHFLRYIYRVSGAHIS